MHHAAEKDVLVLVGGLRDAQERLAGIEDASAASSRMSSCWRHKCSDVIRLPLSRSRCSRMMAFGVGSAQAAPS